MWPRQDRPKHLQSRRVINSMSISEISQFKANFLMEEEKKGGGCALYGKDQVLKAVKFKKGRDDGRGRLHEARFKLRMPICLPRKYWSRIPAKRELFRHFPLAHLGLEGQVNEATILRMHDRRIPIQLDMLYKGNSTRDARADKNMDWVEPTEVRHLQEAVLNYTVIMQALWPLDYSGFVITRVLVEARWGEAGGDGEKQRVRLVRKFFDDCMKENSGRAVRDEPPLEYEEAKAKWVRALESIFPTLSLVAMNPALLLGKAGQQQQQLVASKQPGDGVGAGGSGRGRGGKRGRGGPPAAKAGSTRRIASLSGVPCCYGFNLAGGCKRTMVKTNVCEENGVHYTHACNFLLDKSTGKFCLQFHSRAGNH